MYILVASETTLHCTLQKSLFFSDKPEKPRDICNQSEIEIEYCVIKVKI